MKRAPATLVARVLALLLTPGLSGAGAQGGTYLVQPGDTAWSVARAHGLSVEALEQLNGLSSADLRAGQTLLTGPAEANSAASASAPATTQRGMAVYYGGKPDQETDMTAAHLTLPFGTWVRVTHLRSGKSVLVKVNDRGPFGRAERIIDLSPAAARALGILSEGVAPVTLAVVAGP